ncbi:MULTISPECIES: hypothetical protein [Bacillus amyloliquefaciens group]|uniref:hypothetical protein n=1 Tax=Bacillus amyloliquefaciens group TaxID=1938374 RepID=UPI001F4D19F3|nr:hypothetical protein [Bacillus amyloliquefaciens]
MGEIQGVKDLLDKALKHMGQYMKVRDDFLENDFIQLMGDTSKIVGFLRGSSELMIRKKFESFLKGFSLDEEPTEAQLEKLIEFIDNETKAEFIADAFSKILLARSSKACMIMGSILNDIVKNKDNLSHEHLTCINALMNFYDMDIENYKFLCSYLDSQGLKKNWFTLNYELKQTELDIQSVLITLEKSISNQIIQRGMQLDIDTIDTRKEEYYVITSSGKLLGVLCKPYFWHKLGRITARHFVLNKVLW